MKEVLDHPHRWVLCFSWYSCWLINSPLVEHSGVGEWDRFSDAGDVSSFLWPIRFSRPKEEVTVKKEKRERDRDRQRDSHGRGRGRPEVIQSHSIFEQGPAEMMKKKGTKLPGLWEEGISGFQCRLPKRRTRVLVFPPCSQFSLPCCWLLPHSWWTTGGFPQGTGIRLWICQTWGPLTSSTSKRRRGRQMKKQNRSCACWRRMM